ncbi:MAG: hypothetical protein IT237_13120 [Bacteroidia bacterium]|nr:hypothetical protein [Bacteroidia bacterium]
MSSLKQKIEEILKREKYTFAQLADYLNISEKKLEEGLENKTLELRHLEEISKNLKVPLYSFFRDANSQIDYSERPHFINKLWTNQDSETQNLSSEIELLKQVIAQKEAELANKLK